MHNKPSKLSVYPLVKKRIAFANLSGVFIKPSRLGSSPTPRIIVWTASAICKTLLLKISGLSDRLWIWIAKEKFY